MPRLWLETVVIDGLVYLRLSARSTLSIAIDTAYAKGALRLVDGQMHYAVLLGDGATRVVSADDLAELLPEAAPPTEATPGFVAAPKWGEPSSTSDSRETPEQQTAPSTWPPPWFRPKRPLRRSPDRTSERDQAKQWGAEARLKHQRAVARLDGMSARELEMLILKAREQPETVAQAEAVRRFYVEKFGRDPLTAKR